MMRPAQLFAAALVAMSIGGFAQNAVITIQANKPLAEIQPTMWGIFFEDINFAADGGLYAELVKNRSFEFDTPLMGWSVEKSDPFSNNAGTGSVAIVNRGEEANKRYAKVTVNGERGLIMKNDGFFGMGFKKGLRYHFSLDARVQGASQTLTVELLNDKNEVIGTGNCVLDANDWKKYSVDIDATQTAGKGKLRLGFKNKGTVDIDLISLLPSDTWKGTNLRADLVQLLYDLKPGFLRFPGGCIVEGRTLAQRYQWKKTVGDKDDRELMINRWNTEFSHRPAPDYFQSFGLGFYEYFKLAEDIGASPLPILSCGMACQFNTGEVVPLDEIDPYIQDALDLIEFANGAKDTRWGKLRNDMGHPEPFNLKMIGVGNEQWGPEYIERYKVFAKTIKAKYPQIRIVSGTGPFPDGELFDYAAAQLKDLKAEIVDEHYYRSPEWFFANATRYDKYDRNGPKIFAGEYAAQSAAIASTENKNNWLCALSEAAFMTGLERNADVVHLASYAPLLAHAEGWQWTPDLIWFNSLQAYGTPNYYVQKLFSNNKGTHTLNVLSDGKKIVGDNGLFSSAVLDKNSGELILKIVNAADKPQTLQLKIEGKKLSGGSVTVLAADPSATNSFNDPSSIKPVETTVGKSLKEVNLPARSLSVYRLKLR